MMLGGTLNTSNHCSGKTPAGWCPQLWMHNDYCEPMKLSASNAAWRWQEYGKAMGCKQPLAFDPKGVQCVPK
jgi:hypothetical protein